MLCVFRLCGEEQIIPDMYVRGDGRLKDEMIKHIEEQGEIIIYQSDSGKLHIDVRMEGETLWLTQNQLVELYQTSKSNVSEHIKHIFEESELEEDSVVRKFRTTALDGKNYNMTYYNLDMIISLGYRIKSIIATQFRRWASERIKEYIIKGFTMDDERLKSMGGALITGKNYLIELEIFVRLKKYYIVRCLIFMLQVQTIILKAQNL